jgi:arylsulfatase A
MRLLLALLAAVYFTTSVEAGEKYNVILVYADDMGYGDLACFGSKLHRTPNLDRLATEGAQLTSFYVAQAVCSASRAALLTGCYPNRIGILGALGPNSKNGISDKETTIAEMLQTQGYQTACFGKWHLGHHEQFLPPNHGFQEYAGIPYSNDMWPNHPNKKANYPDLPWIEMTKSVELNPDQTRFTKELTKRAVQFITKQKDKPFFVYLAHPMPHVPLHVAKDNPRQSKGGLYGDVIEEIDWSVGQLLATVKELGLDQKTLIIFTSDNGPWLSYGNHAGTTAGFREGKGTSFEGGVRVPFLARLPGVIPAGLKSNEPAMTIDVLPALAHVTGSQLPELTIDGKSMWKLLTEPGAKSPHEALYFYWNRELQAVRSGPWKLHLPHNYQTLKAGGGKDGKPAAYEIKKLELSLYHLGNDPAESQNLVEKEPEEASRLMKHVEAARSELGDSLSQREGRVRLPGMVK